MMQGGMSNQYELMNVAQNCSSFEPTEQGLVSSIGSNKSVSCKKCSHFKNYKCELNLYDNIAASLDQG
ncbi:hypothetical protein ACFIJ5_00070 [Haloimpatiens sp. FM7330]|uniref:hypothetical protein n=1 Tax=Haloimpatiens sp. FM7330 TaxID=3298610 RepID=UPI00363FD472